MSRLSRSVLLASIALALAGQVQAVEMVVLDSNAAGFKAGQMIPSEQRLGLAAGQNMTLLAPSGRVVKVAGPAEAIPGDSATADERGVLGSLASLVKTRQADSGTLGTFRSAGSQLPDPWLVDVETSGPRCILAEQPLVLWRADGAAAAHVTMGLPAKNWRAQAQWPASSQRLYGPDGMAIGDGETLRVGFGSRHVDLTMHVAPAAIRGDAMRLAWLVERDCMAQAAAFVRQIE